MEILFEDKLSTDRCRRDARGAKFEIVFTERSNRSRFIHSPMHPSSCIPVRHAICDLVETFLNTENNGILILKRVLPRPLSLRKRIDSKSNSPVRDLSRAAVILSQSASAGLGLESGMLQPYLRNQRDKAGAARSFLSSYTCNTPDL